MTLADLEWDFAGDPAGNLEGPRFIHRTYLVRIVNAFLSREAGERAPKRAWWRGEAAGRAERSSPYTLSRSDRNFVEEAFPPPPLSLSGKGKRIRRPVSRVLCRPACAGRGGHSSGPIVADRFSRPTRSPQAGDGPTSKLARDPYSVLLLAGLAMRPLSPAARWALTPPFHPCLLRGEGGLLSVALSLGSPPVGVTHRHVVVEPGLSSTSLRRPRPPGRLIRARCSTSLP